MADGNVNLYVPELEKSFVTPVEISTTKFPDHRSISSYILLSVQDL